MSAPDDLEQRLSDPDDLEQPCPHGDYRSCVVDGCSPLRRVHVANVVVPPPVQVPCMWCGGSSARGQCTPCAALLDAIHAATRAGFAAMIEAFAGDKKLSESPEVLSDGDLAQLRALWLNCEASRSYAQRLGYEELAQVHTRRAELLARIYRAACHCEISQATAASERRS